ncbi:MAG: GYF domain-containing protein [Maricaulaceae bacterium]
MQLTQNQWFVEVGGQSYGPYSLEQMHGFVREGRVIAESLISQEARGPYAYAAAFPQFAAALAPTPAPAPAPTQQPQPAYASQAAYEPQPSYNTQAAPLQTLGHAAPQAAYSAPAHQADSYQQPQSYAPQAEPAPSNVYVVMAEVQSSSAMRFLQALQNYGQAQRVGDTVWVLKTNADAQTLQHGLSETLTRQDRLFISAANEQHSAWFNLGADMDNRIRALWMD